MQVIGGPSAVADEPGRPQPISASASFPAASDAAGSSREPESHWDKSGRSRDQLVQGQLWTKALTKAAVTTDGDLLLALRPFQERFSCPDAAANRRLTMSSTKACGASTTSLKLQWPSHVMCNALPAWACAVLGEQGPQMAPQCKGGAMTTTTDGA